MADHLPETLKPFLDRATEAQERLIRLEAALASTKIDVPDAKSIEKTSQLESELEEVNAKLKKEQKKIEELTIINEKQKYRIEHLMRALRAANEKL